VGCHVNAYCDLTRGTAVSGSLIPEMVNHAVCRRFLVKRMMGFEPTTFCMASRRSSQLSYIRERAEV
jgi:hypothetical protein